MLSASVAGGDPVAMPVDSIAAVVQRILGGGTLRRAYLGVSTQPVELQEALRIRLAIQQTAGLMLLGVEQGAAAERGGLYPGDILLAIGGRIVEDGEALQMALGPEAIGRSTPIKLIRGGDLREITLSPAARPN
jgi:S1-C subfamily serine protease